MNWKNLLIGFAAGVVAYHMLQPVRDVATKVLGAPR